MNRPDLLLHIQALCLVHLLRLRLAHCVSVVALDRCLLPSLQLVLTDGLASHGVEDVTALTR